MKEDIVPGSDPRLGGGGADRLHLRLRHTKTGDEQAVEVLDKDVKVLAMMACNQASPLSHVFGFSADYYRRLLHKVCDGLSLTAGYVPHSLRHGGATYGHLCKMSLVDVAYRGRWKSLKTAEHYIQSGRQALIASSLPADVVAVACAITSVIDAIAAVLPSK